ncbi:putative virion structural protein [Erwinia phage vB_EamM_Parshik]|nr:putative virion structural protein [Erwinia phage vB_EamM_Parshik]
MSFTLRWKNPNVIATVVNIYRDVKDISVSALPAPIATLSNGETEWRDTTAVGGATYYYLLTVTANGKTVATASQKYVVEVKRGIGPMTIIQGDDRLGFMGNVPYDEQWQPTQMPASFQAMYPTLLTDRVSLSKFTRNGKILYLLNNSAQFLGQQSWATLYQAGLVYGTDDFGPVGGHGTLPDTLQDAKIYHNGDVYRMRLARGLTEEGQSPAFAFDSSLHLKDHDAVSALTGFNEYNDLLYSMVVDVPVKQRWANWNQLGSNLLGAGSVASNSVLINGGVLCQEHDTATDKILQRGLFLATTLTATSAIQRINYTTPAQLGRYFPIFELVE